MSKKVDERVVEMRFENGQFEKGVAQSTESLNKLKKSLNLEGAAKGLENVNSTAKNTSGIESLAASLEKVEHRFSTMGIVGMRVIENLTDSAMRFAKKTVGFVTNGIINGGKRRAMNLENANFQLQGLLKNEEAVAAVMQNVSDAVDGTAYSLDAAAKVASQLAASGMKAGDQMFSALRGVAGVAAMTNSSYEDIGRIFTQVAGQGRMMGDQLLQLSSRGMNAAATLASYLTKIGDGTKYTEAQIRDMVSKGQISFDTFAAAMDDAFGEHAKAANSTFEGALSNIKSALGRIGADFIKPLIAQNGPFVNLFNAIRKKVNQIHEITKPIAEWTTKTIGNMVNKLAGFLEKLDIKNPFAKVNGGDVAKTTKAFNSAADAVGNAAQSLEHFQDIAVRVIRGEFGNGAERVKALANAGEDYAKVQTLVNKVWLRNGKNWSDCTVKAEELEEVIGSLSDTELKSLGYTEEQSESLKNLAQQAKDTGKPISELINNLQTPTKKDLFLDAIQNGLKGLSKVLKTVKTAWNDVFSPKSLSDGVYKAVENLHALSEKFVMTDETADKLRRTFSGLFSALSVVKNFVGGTVAVALRVVSKLLSSLHISLLDVTAAVGDAITKFKEWLNSNNIFVRTFGAIAANAQKAALAIRDWVKAFIELPVVQKTVTSVKTAIVNAFNATKEVFSDGKKRIADFIDRWKDLDKITLDNLKAMLIDFKKNVLDEFFKVNFNFSFKGITNKVKGLKTSMKTELKSATNILDGFKTSLFNLAEEVRSKIHIGDIFGYGMAALMVKSVMDIGKSLEMLEGPIAGVTSVVKGLAGIEKSISKYIDAKTFIDRAKAINVLSSAVVKLAIAVALLVASMYVINDINQNGELSTPLLTLIGLMGMLALLAYAVSKVNFSGIAKISGIMFSIGGAIALLALALKTMDGLSSDDKTYKNAVVLIALIGVLGVVAVALGERVPQLSKGSIAIIAFAAAIYILAKALKSISKIDKDSLNRSFETLVGLILALSIAAQGLKGLSFSGGVGLIAMVIALKLLMSALDDLCNFDGNKIAENLLTIIGILGILAALMAITNLAGTNAATGGIGMLALAAAMYTMVKAVKAMAEISQDDLKRITPILISLLGIFGVLIAVSNLAGQFAHRAGMMLLMAAGSLLILTGVIVVLKNMSPDGLWKAVGVIAVLEAMFAGLIAVTHLAKDCKSTLVLLTVTIAMMTVALMTLAHLDPASLDAAKSALASVIATFALLVAVTGMFKGEDLAKKFGGLMSLVLVTGILAAIIVGMAKLSPDQALPCAQALAVLLTALAASLFILSIAGKDADEAMAAAYKMTGVVLILGAILTAMSALNASNAVENAKGLSLLLLALSTSMVILSTFGGDVSGKAIIAAYAMSGVLAILGLVLAEMTALNVSNAIENAAALSILVVSLSDACVLLGVVGLFGMKAIAGIGVLAALIAAIGGIMYGIGALAQYQPSMDEFLDHGIVTLGKIGEGLGNFVGSFVKMFAETAASALPSIATSLSMFMVNLMPFVTAGKMIGSDTSLLDGIVAITKAVLLLTAADFLSGIASIIGLGTSFTGLSEKFTAIGEAMTAFSNATTGVNSEQVKASAEAAASLAEVFNSLPKEGGWFQTVFGEQDLSGFSSKLEDFGNALTSYGNSVADLKVDAINNSVPAANSLVEVLKSLPNSGGTLQKFLGNKDMTSFSNDLSGFGTALVNYGESVTDLKVDAIKNSVPAAEALADFMKALPSSGGAWQKVFGNKNASDFSNQLKAFGTSMKNLSDTLSGVEFSYYDSAATALNSITNAVASFDVSHLNSIVTSVGALGTRASTTFTTNVENSTIKNAFDAPLNKAVSSARSGMSKFYDAGRYLVAGFANGIRDNIYLAQRAAIALADNTESAARSRLRINSPSKVFRKIGAGVPEGFAQGIERFSYLGARAVESMSNNAIDSASKVLSNINAVLTDDVNTQPTIRPIVDLSNVENSSDAISSMLAMDPTVSAFSNVNSISAMMNRNQNGANDDVVSAIKDLGKTIGKTSGDTYQINGITYDSGSEVSEAIQTLIHASIIEGRR
jgi:hypothetical protein|nr:MAG TPA: tail tape measure [Caudoviricetes sp.]